MPQPASGRSGSSSSDSEEGSSSISPTARASTEESQAGVGLRAARAGVANPRGAKRACSMAFAPAGPQSKEELHSWASHALSVFEHAQLTEQFYANLLRGVCVCTKYSGMGCPEQALDIIGQAAKKDLASRGGDPEAWLCPFSVYSATEMLPLAQRALLSHVGPCKPAHVFKNVLDVLGQLFADPQAILDRLQSVCLEVSRDSAVELLRIKGLKDIKPAKRAQLRQESHDKSCRTFLSRSLELYQEAQPALNPSAHCVAHDQECQLRPDSMGKINIEIAGTTCVAFSARGKQQQWGHESSIPCIVWLWSVLQNRPQLIVHECTPRFTDRA